MKKLRLVQSLILVPIIPLLLAVPPAEELIPSDTVAFVSIRDWPTFMKAFKQSPYGRLFQDPSMEEFLKNIKQNLSHLINDTQIISKYVSLSSGQITLAIIKNNERPQQIDLGFILWTEISGREHEADQFLKDLKKSFPRQSEAVEYLSIRGHNFIPSSYGIIGIVKPMLIVGNNPKIIEMFIDNLNQEKSKSLYAIPLLSITKQVLSKYTIHKSVIKGDADATTKDAGELFVWLNFSEIIKLVETKLSSNPSSQERLNSVWQTLAAIKQAAWSYSVGQKGYYSAAFLHIPQTEQKELLDIFDNGDCSPPDFVSSEVVSFLRLRVDISKLWAKVQYLLNLFLPGLGNEITAQIEANLKSKIPNFPGLQKGFFDLFGNELIQINYMPQDISIGSITQPRSVILISSASTDQLVKLLINISKATGLDCRQVNLQGISLYQAVSPTINLSPGISEAPTEQGLYFGVYKNYLLLALSINPIKKLLSSSPDKALKKNPLIIQLKSSTGDWKGIGFGYQNDREYYRLLWTMLKSTQFWDSCRLFLSFIDIKEVAAIIREIERSCKEKLPPYEKVSNYFNVSVGCGNLTQEGFVIQSIIWAP